MKDPKDLFSGHSADYARFRPQYPAELYKIILHQVQRDTAWDAGTGNGQVAVQLSRYFRRVIGTDISRNQLEQAPDRENITWKQVRAEDSGLAGQRVNLITVGQALHWFDIPAFKREVRRVLSPGGTLACFGYGLIHGPAVLNPILEHFYSETIGIYWPPERRWIERAYDGIGIPFTDSYKLTCDVCWGISELSGYLSTWSAVKACIRKTGQDPVAGLRHELITHLNEPVRFQFPVFLKLWKP